MRANEGRMVTYALVLGFGFHLGFTFVMGLGPASGLALLPEGARLRKILTFSCLDTLKSCKNQF